MSTNPPRDKRIAAFYDLDRTLLGVNSALLFAKRERLEGRISWAGYLQSALYMGLYHFSLVDVKKALEKALSLYAGSEENVLRERTYRWFEEDVAKHLQPGGQASLAWHREQGHPRILLTGSSRYVAEVCQRLWELDGWLANCFEVDEKGLLTGHFEGPICYGDGKVIWAEQWAKAEGISLEDSFFYTDSYTDLPMLLRVGHPRIVNPDPRLRREAKKRSWPILQWQETAPSGPLQTP